MIGEALGIVEYLDVSRRKFIIPAYQRNYSWKTKNCKQLFDDLLNVNHFKKQSHFFGSIVSNIEGKNVILIDGQQRITTVSLLLIAIINIIKDGKLEAEEETLVDQITDLIVDKYHREQRKVRLKPFRNDCQAFDALVANDPSEFIESSKVTVNYRYFYNRLVNDKEISVDKMFEAIEKLTIIDISLNIKDGDDPQLIFESINSTGEPLTEADKIRNFILMNMTSDMQELFYDNYWSKIEEMTDGYLEGFVRDYLTIKTSQIPKFNNVYESFKLFCQDDNSLSKVEEILQDMKEYAQIYYKVKTYDLGHNECNYIIERLDMLDMKVLYSYLLQFIKYGKEVSLSAEEMIKVLSCVETYIFRRQICDVPANGLGNLFASLHRRVCRLMKEKDTYSSVLIYILESLKLSGVFPTDDDFVQAFTKRDVYHMKSKNRAYMFERLENGNSREKNDVAKNIANGVYSVEHIMPQNLSPQWLSVLGDDSKRVQEDWEHTIANLTITAYNSEYSNRTFAEKKHIENGFLDSGLRLNQYIAKFDKWTEDELIERRNHIARLAVQIWKYPDTAFVPPIKEDDVICLNDEFNFTYRNIKFLTFMGTMYQANSWGHAVEIITKLLFELDPDIMYRESLNGDNLYIVTKPENNRTKKIAEHIYVYTSSNTEAKIRLIKMLLEKYRMDEDEISFGLHPVNTSSNDESN